MQYFISYQYPHQHFIDLELHIADIQTNKIALQLPTWRAGRYQLQYYVKNIQRFTVTDKEGKPLFFQKTTKDRWEVDTAQTDYVKVKYNYYAQQFDAGGSWVEEDLFYINFVNCLLYMEGRMEEIYEVNLLLPENYQIACGLFAEEVSHNRELKSWQIRAKNFAQIIDAPLLASADLQHQTYQVSNSESHFHIWFYGNVSPNWVKLVSDFKAFTQKQIAIFGDFPESEYHFLFLIPYFTVYHGVEHFNSTVIVLGSDEMFAQTYFYNDIVGIASHELFHAWNICKIRPKELMPYDWTQENYFKTGFVVEGITTFYGDWLLARSGVWSKEQYFSELKNLFRRHFFNFGRLNLSVADSSFDLWLDGYVSGIPNRKGSIYVEGAIACLILDLEIRQATDNQKTIDDVMRLLWERFGKTQIGYTLANYINLVNEVAGKSMQHYFDECIFGANDLSKRLYEALSWIGCELFTSYSQFSYTQDFGFVVAFKNSELIVELIQPHSPADAVIALKDRILAVDSLPAVIDGQSIFVDIMEGKKSVALTLERNGKSKSVVLIADGKSYLPEYEVKELENMTKKQAYSFEKWLDF